RMILVASNADPRQGMTKRNSSHRQSLVLLSRRHSLIKCDAIEAFKQLTNSTSDMCLSSNNRAVCDSIMKNTQNDISNDEEAIMTDFQAMPKKLSLDSLRKPLIKSLSRTLSRSVLIKPDSVTNLEEKACKLEPTVEGRIRIATKELVTSLRSRKVSRTAINEEDESDKSQ
ncbi:unnamed protein product, partial [Meganyctiphanes norvegica]